MESLLFIIVLFVTHLAVIFSLALVVSGLSSLVAIAGLGGRAATKQTSDTTSDAAQNKTRRRVPRLLGTFGVLGAIATTLTIAGPLFFGEHLVQPYLDGMAEEGKAEVSLSDASINLVGGKLRADDLHIRQTDDTYNYDVRIDVVSARLSPLSALGKRTHLQRVAVTGATGWLSPGNEKTADTDDEARSRPFSIGSLVLNDITLQWRPIADKPSAGTLEINDWETTDIDHEYTLLDLLGHTRASGTFLDGAFTSENSIVGNGRRASWIFEDVSLSKVGASIGGPMRFVRGGDLSLTASADWDDALQKPAQFAVDVQLDNVSFGPNQEGGSMGQKLLGALGEAVSQTLPKESRSLSFGFDFEVGPETLRGAKSINEFDLYTELQDELRRVLVDAIKGGR